LVNEWVFSTLDFVDFETCVNCIKGKQSNKFKKGAQRSSNLLKIIHTYICCPDIDASSLNSEILYHFYKWLLRYMHLYSKDVALDAFRVFKAEVEKKCEK